MIRRSPERVRAASSCPRVYIGFSTGINNPVGILGPQIDIAVLPVLSFATGIGLSTWGYKTYLEGRYYFKTCNRGWAVAGGVTHNTGLDRVELTDAETIAGEMDVTVELKPQTNFMISGYHFFNLGRSGRNRFHLQAGYSVPITEVQYRQLSGAPLTRKSSDAVMAIAPGGLILGLGFSFGVGG